MGEAGRPSATTEGIEVVVPVGIGANRDTLAFLSASIAFFFLVILSALIFCLAEGSFRGQEFGGFLRSSESRLSIAGTVVMAFLFVIFTRGFRVSIYLGKDRIRSWVAWKRWLWRIGIRLFPPVSVSTDEVGGVRFAVRGRDHWGDRVSAEASFQLLGRGRVVEIPAASVNSLRVMDTVLLLCPRAEVDPETGAVLDLLRRGMEPRVLRGRLSSLLGRYVAEGRLESPSGFEPFNARHERQLPFIRRFIEEGTGAVLRRR
jgi:hypothetical protein